MSYNSFDLIRINENLNSLLNMASIPALLWLTKIPWLLSSSKRNVKPFALSTRITVKVLKYFLIRLPLINFEGEYMSFSLGEPALSWLAIRSI